MPRRRGTSSRHDGAGMHEVQRRHDAHTRSSTPYDANDEERRLDMHSPDTDADTDTDTSPLIPSNAPPTHPPTSDAAAATAFKTNLPHTRPRQIVRMKIPYAWLQHLCFVVCILIFLTSLVLWKLLALPPPTKMQEFSRKPHAWEEFERLGRFYGGVRTLVGRGQNVPEYTGNGSKTGEGEVPKVVFEAGERGYEELLRVGPKMEGKVLEPYPEYGSEEYVRRYGVKNDCYLGDKKVEVPRLRYYPGVPYGFPDAPVGSNKLLGIRDDICFDRFGRLGPYGYGYPKDIGGSGAGLAGDRTDIEGTWASIPPVDYRRVNWGEAQEKCIAANAHRFTRTRPQNQTERNRQGEERVQRTVILVRTWAGYEYPPETVMYLRSLIAELALLTGGEYTVHFLVHVKDNALQIWSDEETYNRTLREALPEEFQGMGTLWSEKQMEMIYYGIEQRHPHRSVYQNYRSTFMPVQWFAVQHPEFDFVWNWEMDIRNTGHWYEFFEGVARWAREQPRRELWERSGRYYVPSVHGDWEEFKRRVHLQTTQGTVSPDNLFDKAPSDRNSKTARKDALLHPLRRKPEPPIWGPLRPEPNDILQVPDEGQPPTPAPTSDAYHWGRPEDADLIVLNPLFDPHGTTWLLRDDASGYNRTRGPPPRRAAIITASRLSRKLLLTMHRESALLRHTMFSEMWPASCALHHGFKAVFAPHAVYFDRRWPTRYLESVFNAGRNGATGGARTTVYGDREHNFRGVTWFYNARHAANLWTRWLGEKGAGGKGGEEQEVLGEGRMCLPPMLLHPVKGVVVGTESELDPEDDGDGDWV